MVSGVERVSKVAMVSGVGRVREVSMVREASRVSRVSIPNSPFPFWSDSGAPTICVNTLLIRCP